MSTAEEKPPARDGPLQSFEASPVARDSTAKEGILEHSENHHGTHRHHDPNWDGSGVDFSHIDEAKVLRKMDLRLIPVLAILYLLSFLDRGNIGNAKIQGLTDDLHLSGTQYNICLTVFFLTYCAFEIPSNLVLKKFRPSIWLPSIMIVWGAMTVCLGVVKDYHGLLIVRIFLGVAEAGLYPGVAYYLTLWYCTSEMAFRQGLFFSAASLAGAFSGLLAFAIVKMNNVGGYAGWRWIFILEGLLTVVVAFCAYFVMYDFPDTAKFLTEEEKAWAVHRLKYQGSKRSGTLVAEADHFQWKFVRQALTDWQLYLCLFMYWGIVCPLYGISLFLPTIINQLGYTAAAAQLLTIPIYVTATVACIVVSWFSDQAARKGKPRSPYVFVPMLAILAGFIMAIAGSAHGGVPGVVYAGVFITTCGIYPAFPQNITWISNNLAGSYKRAAGMAFQIGLGNLGGAMASNFYRSEDSPKYLLGHGLEIMFVVMGLIAVVLLRLSYQRINHKRELKLGGLAGDSAERVETLDSVKLGAQGDRAVTFRYVI